MPCSLPARLAGAILCAGLAFGCAPGQELTVESGLRGAQRAKDTEARILKASICAMSIGAYHRVNDDAERRALDILCDGADE